MYDNLNYQYQRILQVRETHIQKVSGAEMAILPSQ
jgi:hypothetical protein